MDYVTVNCAAGDGRSAGRWKKSLRFALLSVLAALFFFSLVSCAASAEGKDIFGYAASIRSVEGVVHVSGGEYGVRMTFGDSECFEIVSPEALCGVKYVFENGEAFLIADDMKMPVSDKLTAGIRSYFDAFSVTDDDIVGISKNEKNGNTTVSVKNDRGEGIYEMGEDGLPVKITFDGVLDFVMDDVRISAGAGD